ncbi:hypothetical protein [Streptomyces djakartensis]|uniref:Serine/threonine protein kinase n=1 Tax=Streptomyces djakartensis TaxID=68193 RepID=A0ABQ2ZNF5_9ACTN|nr:hypothetical protein [Streptomyces djakartensis]GGY19367.1 hypothetical protein GCM10010384_27140 [Streptomyces djakartensis]
MGKSASREDRGKRSSFSVSYEGGGQRDPSTQVKLGRLSYKGPATAMVAVAAVATVGVLAYQWLDGQGNAGGTGTGPGTRVTSGADAPSGTNTATAAPDTGTGATTAPAPATSGPPASPPGSAAPAAAGNTELTEAAVREHRKVVLQRTGSVDLDFTQGGRDITYSLASNGNGWTIAGDRGDLATVDGPATAESCAAATDFGFIIDQKNITKGLTACVLTDENRAAAITVLGWQKDDIGLSSVTMDVTTWEKPEAQ